MKERNFGNKVFWFAIMLTLLLLTAVLLLNDSDLSCENDETRLKGNGHQNVQKNNSFDILIFTQQWPNTFCDEWIERDDKNECQLPKLKNAWSIHGIWPTQFHKKGPLNCNSTWKFNKREIQPIEADLMEKWINIEKGTPVESLWKHEWEKHGTCAIKIKELNSQLKYFQGGLNLYNKFAVSKLLESSNIKPGMQYDLSEIHSALNHSIGNNFAIRCERDLKTKKQLLYEIRICLDLELNLHNCDGIIMNGGDKKKSDTIISNCKRNEKITYPSTPSMLQRKKIHEITAEKSTWMESVYDLFKNF